ncbi:hypothetical protein DB30_01631 [Enhygromyxa salina]|uniref:Uncharacterized protein n=1 Tax=Enhygromyxa salina TaxID=215803 RepID=A0A0C2CRM8_9BACT|nr:hypothetical protein [Enhygromyxa salina]KIG12290.1 hypothetical protein DB30_01631 [Enhygromyxa salina]
MASEGPAAPGTSSDVKVRIDRAIEAWRKGDWTEVRDLLEPIIRESDIDDEFQRESALRYLAEATLLDEGLEQTERAEQAQLYITRLLDSSPDWAPPSGLHGRPFYELVARVRSERDAQLAEACRGRLLACEADLTELSVDYRAAQDKIGALQEDLANEDVFLTEVVKRNRGLALLPFGVGHFTNGNPGIGGGFLALELVAGGAALGLLIYRSTVFGCVRTDGFNPKSLECKADNIREQDIPARQDAVETIRSAETIMGWVFVSSIVLDLTLAQVLFKPIEVIERGKKTRRELDAELEATEAEAAPKRKKSGSSEGPPSPGQSPGQPPLPTDSPSVRLRVKPHPVFMPAGLGLGVTLQF